MNLDDPKLTAYALGELSEAEKARMEKSVADSPEAQQFVRETHDIARILIAEYAGENQADGQPANLIDIRDDPWFWSRARPLAIAALIASAALLAAIILGPRNLRNHLSAETKDQPGYIQLENVETGSTETSPPDAISNPFRPAMIARVERVVIGEIPPNTPESRSEIRVIEVISDSNRLTALKNRLATNRLTKIVTPQSISHGYQLMFLDKAGTVVAAARFYNVPGAGFMLQLSRNAGTANDHYFVGKEAPLLPADWKGGIDYSSYVISFPDWQECIGYSPGA